MMRLRLFTLVAVAMFAFAGNSLLCRLALKHTAIDAATFTTLRLVSGAVMLWLLVQWQRRHRAVCRAAEPRQASLAGNWLSSAALFVYAVSFSFAYISMSAASGALLLFGSVQLTMIGYGLCCGERLRGWQLPGFVLAQAGLVALMLPGLATPSVLASLSMLLAGAAWGVYSLRGRALRGAGSGDPTAVTAGNFIRTVPITLALSLLSAGQLSLDVNGMVMAVASGALASGVGYAVWYHTLPWLASTHAATVQLSVPVIAAIGGVVLLDERLTLPMVCSSAAILGGIALVILKPK